MHLKIRMIWNQFILISLSFVCVFIFGKFQLKICRAKNKTDLYDIGYINLDTVISWKSYEINPNPNSGHSSVVFQVYKFQTKVYQI